MAFPFPSIIGLTHVPTPGGPVLADRRLLHSNVGNLASRFRTLKVSQERPGSLQLLGRGAGLVQDAPGFTADDSVGQCSTFAVLYRRAGCILSAAFAYPGVTPATLPREHTCRNHLIMLAFYG
jgi:hypothetical protein